VLAGWTTAEAARRIHMAPATLRVHLHRASRKLGATSRLEAISMALRAGLIRAPSGSKPATPRGEGAGGEG
jgi:DNA-binding NarL/FixJ family response regulator